MAERPSNPLVAVDIGNSRVKFGLFEPADLARALDPAPPSGVPHLAAPVRTCQMLPNGDSFDVVRNWLSPLSASDVHWRIASVQRAYCTKVLNALRNAGADSILLLTASDLPLEISLPRPDKVGIDRLAAALAANRLRAPGRPAVIVDLGTAITVDLVSVRGAFLGGAILPGIGMAARALHEFTDLLPAHDMRELADPPPAVGEATEAAMRSGLFWGAVGGVRHLIEQYTAEVDATPQVFLTGGAAPAVARLLAGDAIYEPHLTLAGIGLTARALPW